MKHTPKKIAIGKADGALVDENGFYLNHKLTNEEIVKRYNAHELLVQALVAAYKRKPYSEFPPGAPTVQLARIALTAAGVRPNF